MKITTYKPNKTKEQKLLTLIKKKYGKNKNFDFFFLDFQKAYKYCQDNENISFTPIGAFEGEKLVAHIALIIDKRLKSSEAFFGFFESPIDQSACNKIWEKLIAKAKELEISILKGPINGSIWHQYRVIKQTDRSPLFKSEPMSEEFYYHLLTALNPSSEISYYSASREKFDQVMPRIETEFEKLITAGFTIQEITNVSLEQLHSIGEISKTVFSKNSWGYTQLSKTEFLTLYSSEKLNLHLNKLYLLYKNQQIIGYCGTTKEDKQTIILKTICILPQYQGLGLGNALAYKIHLDAQKEGFTKVIYALIRDDNQIKNFPKQDAVFFRRYAAFEFKI